MRELNLKIYGQIDSTQTQYLCGFTATISSKAVLFLMASSLGGVWSVKRIAAATQEVEAEEEVEGGSLASIVGVVACGRTSWDSSSKREAIRRADDCEAVDDQLIVGFIGGGFGHPLGSVGWPSHPLVPKATPIFLSFLKIKNKKFNYVATSSLMIRPLVPSVKFSFVYVSVR
jgi:hypothetical protein